MPSSRPWPTLNEWTKAGFIDVFAYDDEHFQIHAPIWDPEWLREPGGYCIERPLFTEELRRRIEPCESDPFLADIDSTLVEIQVDIEDVSNQLAQVQGQLEDASGDFNQALASVINDGNSISQFLQTAAQNVTAGIPAATQASWKTPAIPVGPS